MQQLTRAMRDTILQKNAVVDPYDAGYYSAKNATIDPCDAGYYSAKFGSN
jgi:hypothetical protein